MNKSNRFFLCPLCGRVITVLNDSGSILSCCDTPMQELCANSGAGSFESHLPVVSFVEDGFEVRTGNIDHPMTEEHYIEWMCLVSEGSSRFFFLNPGDDPVHLFASDGQRPFAAYSYCSIHGLWMTEI